MTPAGSSSFGRHGGDPGRGLLRIRAPLAMVPARLDETGQPRSLRGLAGKNTGIDADGPTGADEMRSLLRRQALRWGILCVAGRVAIFAGLLLR